MVFKKGESGNKLTQFKPGQSGNPKGLPKGYKQFKKAIVKASVKKINYRDLNNKKQSMMASEALVVSLIGNAIYKQDMRAAKLIIETMSSYDQEIEQNATIAEEDNSETEEDWPDLSRLTDEELKALEVVANAVERIRKEEEQMKNKGSPPNPKS